MKIFFDSDAIISLFYSQLGAADLLINHKYINRFIFYVSLKEIKIMVKELKTDLKKT